MRGENPIDGKIWEREREMRDFEIWYEYAAYLSKSKFKFIIKFSHFIGFSFAMKFSHIWKKKSYLH